MGTKEAEALLAEDKEYAEERAQKTLERLRDSQMQNTNAPEQAHSPANEHTADHAHAGHHGGGGFAKNVFAFFGLLLAWIGQAIKRAPEMAGKGGGGGGGHGGGGHGGGGGHH